MSSGKRVRWIYETYWIVARDDFNEANFHTGGIWHRDMRQVRHRKVHQKRREAGGGTKQIAELVNQKLLLVFFSPILPSLNLSQD